MEFQLVYRIQTIRYGIMLGLMCLGGAVHPVLAAENGAAHHASPGSNQARLLSPISWCGDYKLGQMTEAERLTGHNLSRLRAAESELAPGFEAETVKTGLYLLADYQALLERRDPNITLAASYLAMASAVPVTAARYRQVNALLCVSVAPATARAIRTQAEALRRQENKPPKRKDAES